MNASFEKYFTGTSDGAATVYYDNSAKLATTSTGINVTGSVVSDGLTVDGDASFTGDITIKRSGVLTRGIEWNRSGTIDAAIKLHDDEIVKFDNFFNNGYQFRTGASGSEQLKLKINSNGNISFYEDTGTTAKFFWDASEESLRVPLGLYNNSINAFPSTGYAAIYSTGAGGSAPFNEAGHLVLQARSSGALRDIIFATGNGAAERMRIDSSGRVGIGTTSPGSNLEVSSATGSASPTATELRIGSSTQASNWSLTDPWGTLGFYSADTSGGGAGNLAEISARMENTVGGFASLDFTLQNPASSYAQTNWLSLKNSASLSQRRVDIEADGGLYVANNVGIGTASPGRMLHLNGSVPIIRLEDSDLSGYAEISANAQGSGITFNDRPNKL